MANTAELRKGVSLIAWLIALVLIAGIMVGCSSQQKEENKGYDDTTEEEVAEEETYWEEFMDNPGFADEGAVTNHYARLHYGLESSSSDPLTQQELDHIAASIESGNATIEQNQWGAGVYKVGSDIPAGTYWIDGVVDGLDYFFIFEEAEGGFNAVSMNHFYAHSMATLEEGQIFAIDNKSHFTSVENAPKVEAPYTNGVYRVGVDVPAGTYTLSGGPVTDDYCGFYLMKSLDYTDADIVISEQTFDDPRDVEGSNATVEFEEGAFVELYNIVATPA